MWILVTFLKSGNFFYYQVKLQPGHLGLYMCHFRQLEYEDSGNLDDDMK